MGPQGCNQVELNSANNPSEPGARSSRSLCVSTQAANPFISALGARGQTNQLSFSELQNCEVMHLGYFKHYFVAICYRSKRK